MPFVDRKDAGRRLAEALRGYGGDETVALAVPRGGVTVAAEVARALGSGLDVFVVRKLGFPGHEELAMGAIASGGVRVMNEDILGTMKISEDVVETVASREQRELERRERIYRGSRPPLQVEGKVAILVDDGAATGASMLAAVEALRRLRPKAIVVALPTASESALHRLQSVADDVVCLETPEPFFGVGLWYQDFRQVSDQEVAAALEEARTEPHPEDRATG